MKYVLFVFSLLLFSCDLENLSPSSKIIPVDDFSNLQPSASLTIETKVTTNSVSSVTTTSAVLSAKYQSDISDLTEKGICYSIKTSPTISDKVYIGDKSKSSISTTAMNLISGTTYYVRGYYKTKKGTFYGNEVTFKTNFDLKMLKTGLVAFYTFNGNANDASGNGKNGTIMGGVTNTTDRFGRSNAAFLFNGSNGRIDVPSLDNIPYKPISYSAWAIVKSYFPASPTGFQFKAIIGRNTAYVLDCGVIGFSYVGNNTFVNNNFLMWRGGGILTGPEPSSNVIPQLGTWVHIVFTQNSSGDWKWYQNGVLTNNGNFTDSQNQFNFFQIGSCNNQTTNNDNTYWNDKLDDIGVWNRVLTSEEVKFLFENDFKP